MKTLTAYVDGSYNDDIKRYGFGCVFIDNGAIYVQSGSGDSEEALKQRNVSGEMLGAMYATQMAIKNGFQELDIFYDYVGIEAWVTGEWKAKNDLTQKYRDYMRRQQEKIKISFVKVKSHSKVEYNELADKMAKRGVEEGKGVPAATELYKLESFE